MGSERGTSTRKGPRKMKEHIVECWRAAEQRNGELGDTVKRIGRGKDGDMGNHGMVLSKLLDDRRGEIKRKDDFKHSEGVLRKQRNCPG